MSAGDELRTEVRVLAAQFRTLLENRARSGTLGVATGPMPRMSPENAAAVGVPAQAKAPDLERPARPNRPARPKTHADPDAAPIAAETFGADAGCVGGSADEAAGAGDPSDPSGAPGLSGARGLQMVRDELGDCQRCGLAGTRRNLVFGVGNPEADLVFVGEAPGRDEDEQGEPFVGKAGQLLTKMIEAMGYTRQDVYICNVIKCRPPENRNPEPDEVASCEPFLKKQLAALRPKVIVALGKFAAQCLCNENTPITRLRGNFRSYQGIQVMPTFHPAYLLRSPDEKRVAWADLKAVLEVLKNLGIQPPNPPRA